MIQFVLLSLGLLGQWLFGFYLAVQLLSLNDRSKPVGMHVPIQELAGLGFVLGIGMTAWGLFIWSLAFGVLGLFPSVVFAILGYLFGLPALRRLLRDRKGVVRTLSPQESAVCRACAVVIATLFVSLLFQTLLTPQRLWDERAIFALKARVLFEDRSLQSPALLHPDFVQYHPRYPLLLPLAEEHIYALLGHVDDRLSKVVFPFLYLGLVLTTAGVLLRNLAAGAAWLGALMMATVPVMVPYEYGFLCGQADAPVACFHGVTVLYLWDVLGRARRNESVLGSSLVAGTCAGLTLFTKDEGIAYLMIDSVALGLLTLGSLTSLPKLGSYLRLAVVYGLAAGSIIVPWFWHRRSLPLTTEMNYFGRMTPQLLLSRLDTLAWTVPHLGRRMFIEWREWGLQWWLMIAAFVSRPLRVMEPSQLLLVLDVSGALASLLVAGMAAPAQLDEHIGGSSHRFLMQISPVAVLFAIGQFFPNRVESKDAVFAQSRLQSPGGDRRTAKPQ